jgi:hypothetical protein
MWEGKKISDLVHGAQCIRKHKIDSWYLPADLDGGSQENIFKPPVVQSAAVLRFNVI